LNSVTQRNIIPAFLLFFANLAKKPLCTQLLRVVVLAWICGGIGTTEPHFHRPADSASPSDLNQLLYLHGLSTPSEYSKHQRLLPIMAEFVRAQIFGTTFEITSR
jgi:hypothetical protein